MLSETNYGQLDRIYFHSLNTSIQSLVNSIFVSWFSISTLQKIRHFSGFTAVLKNKAIRKLKSESFFILNLELLTPLPVMSVFEQGVFA